MNPWKCLYQLAWLTGDDGRVAFWKLAYITVLVMQGVVVFHLVDHEGFVGSLWPLVWLFALDFAASFGIKGLQLWFRSTQLKTEAKSDLGSLIEKRRDEELGIEPS